MKLGALRRGQLMQQSGAGIRGGPLLLDHVKELLEKALPLLRPDAGFLPKALAGNLGLDPCQALPEQCLRDLFPLRHLLVRDPHRQPAAKLRRQCKGQ